MSVLRVKRLTSLWRLGLPLLLLSGASLYPHLVLAKTPTPTITFTPTLTFTPTPTDSLNVFESPTPTSTITPDPLSFYITYPKTGDSLSGEVQITGKSAVTGFVSSQVEFAYLENPTGTWFLIQKSETPVNDGILANWNTNNITDGRYNLRLRVFITTGEVREVIVKNVRVANYSPTDTPGPVVTATPLAQVTDRPAVTPTQMPTPVSTHTPNPTPTGLPANPASLSSNAILFSIARGALVVILFFAFFGLILSIRKK